MLDQGHDANNATASLTTQFYESWWPGFSKEPDGEERMRMSFIVDALNDFAANKNLELLDLGCGRGWLAPFLSKYGNVTGIDFAPAGIGFARHNFSDHGTFFLADPSLPFLGLSETKQFDVVVCSEVIEHVQAGLAVLRHEGRATNERFGHFRAFQHRKVRFLFHHLRLEHLYARLILSHALYQVVAARKRR